ncbi:MAG: hypothetical protein UW52_C0046G0007 [Candidatus Gottesmanbacteria bacterium GW2011_GWA1_44_24b]|nr:MAG: hypothetical protein UW52_C0046G0007 [Candidatus Gottesmanbacteria bacterium GW2011_GWA1_44_24b]
MYFLHIRDAIILLEQWTKHTTLSDLKSDEKLESAVIRQLEIIGEAARHISKESKLETPEIPWEPIVGIRNRLIHGYFSINLEKVWRVIKKDIPKLKIQIYSLLETLEKEE